MLETIKKGDWVALVVKGHDLPPVGSVTQNKDGVLTIELVNALFKEPWGEYRVVNYEDITAFRIARKADGWKENGVQIIDDHALWAFQTKWHERNKQAKTDN